MKEPIMRRGGVHRVEVNENAVSKPQALSNPIRFYKWWEKVGKCVANSESAITAQNQTVKLVKM